MESFLGWIGQMIPTSQISEQVGYVSNLKRNVDDLKEEALKLKYLCDDMESEEWEASTKRMRLTKQAQTWLDHARANLDEIRNVCPEFDRSQTSNNGFFSNLSSRYKLGKSAVEKLECVRRDLNERSGFKLLAMSPPPRVMEMDVPMVGQSSSQRIMDEIWDLLHDEHTSVICVYGMGGIGKTTLLKAINNKLQATSEFDYVIWVAVSKELNLQRIQKEIMSRLRLGFNENDSYQDRSLQLREWLSNKRYMLILDDLWDCIDLHTVGIPPNKGNRSRTAITTRRFEVCNDMEADAKIRMSTLTKAEAWDLFAANVGEEVVDQPHIKDVANDVVMECGGLPLAIMTVAKAMQGEKNKELWEDALRALRASVPEIRGMEPQVFRPLKLSYDDLKDEKVKMCFLYCSLFPEDDEIGVKHLVRLWIMEGFIDNVDNLVDASNKGHRIVEMLKRRCLLEEGIQDTDTVKMHDIIRDLALYIASSSCDEGPKILVKAGFGKGLPLEETWREFERISLMMNGIAELPINPKCPNLVSLFLSYNPITNVRHSFFEFMPALQVLDLSFTSITSLSVSSSWLLNLRVLILRGCHTLTEVPFLGQLKELQFLDIKSSGIRNLPKEMQNLVKLKKLNMSKLSDSNLLGTLIPSSVILGLSSLEDLRLQKTKVNWARGSELAVENNATLGEVAKLKRLTILKIIMEDFDCIGEDVFLQHWSKLKKFKVFIGPSQTLWREMDCMKQVHIHGGNSYPHGVKVMMTHTEGLEWRLADLKDVSQFVGVANDLRMLNIYWCEKMECILDWNIAGENALQNIEKLHLKVLPKLQELFIGEVPQRCLQKLNEIVLSHCHNLKSLFSSEMVQRLDQLQTLHVRNCYELKKIIEGHDTSLLENPFPQLRNFTLEKLPKLKSIIRRDRLALPSLIKLQIEKCPKLRLPRRPDTTDWPSISSLGNAWWEANPQQSE